MRSSIIFTVLALSLSAGAAGCSALDRPYLVKSSKPLGEKDGATWFKAVIETAGYPEADPASEQIRRQWIAKSLQDNGLPGAAFEIVGRRPMLRYKPLLSRHSDYDIYYTIRVPLTAPAAT